MASGVPHSNTVDNTGASGTLRSLKYLSAEILPVGVAQVEDEASK